MAHKPGGGGGAGGRSPLNVRVQCKDINYLQTLEKKIDRSAVTSTSQQEQRPRDIDYSGPEPNETQSKSTGGSSIGFCYIGEYNGNRSCASVKESSNCMSGDIFDTKEQCVNPRA